MGTFLAASSIVNRKDVDIQKAIESYIAEVGGTFEPRAGSIGEPNIAAIQTSHGNTTVLYPDGFSDWDEASKFLSTRLQTSVFSFHIHDGDLWMLVGFDQGDEVAWFNPIPNYWGEIPEDERKRWAGDARTIAALVPGVDVDSIRNYLRFWTEDICEGGVKAYEDDEFSFGVDWQLTDFMRRLGFVFPDGQNGSPTGQTYYMKVRRRRPPPSHDEVTTPSPTPSPNVPKDSMRSQPQKPWWKFW